MQKMSWKTNAEQQQLTRCTYFLIVEQFQYTSFSYEYTPNLVLASSLLTEIRQISTSN